MRVVKLDKSMVCNGLPTMIILSKTNQESYGLEMCTMEIIQLLVGAKNIVVKAIFLDVESSYLAISAWTTKKKQCRCGLCLRKAKHYDAGC